MRQVTSLSRRQLLSGTLAATLGLSGCNALQGSGSGMPEGTADVAATDATTLVLTETTTHAVTTTSSTPSVPTSSTETVGESDESHVEGVTASESYDAIEWHPGGNLILDDGAVLELTEATT